jgi:hypothetical protein
MDEWPATALALAFAGAAGGAALLARHQRGATRGLQRALAAGAALGGMALLLLFLQDLM